MPSLHELQREFARDIFAAPATDLGCYVAPNGLSGVRRVRVYRNNVFSSLTDALRACYPVIERLMGQECFAYIAESYIKRHPSRCGDLRAYGHRFPKHLSALPALVDFPYLADVARLEWARQEVYHTEESPPLDIASLANVAKTDYEFLRLHLNGASRLLRSNYPILRIWQVNQPDFAGDRTVALAAGGMHLLIIRRDFSIDIEDIGTGEYAFLSALAKHHPLSRASDLALEQDSAFDLISTLQKHVSRRTLIAFSLPQSPSNA